MRRFFEERPDFQALETSYAKLLAEPGVGVLTAAPGLGKTRAMRHLRDKHARDRDVVRVDGEQASPEAPWRVLGQRMGVDLNRRRWTVWRVLARSLGVLSDPRAFPVLVVDEAQHVSNGFLVDLSDFLDAVDWRVTVWLVGLPGLAAKLLDPRHRVLLRRVSTAEALAPLDLDAFVAMLAHEGLNLRAAEIEDLWNESEGYPRRAAKLLRGRDET